MTIRQRVLLLTFACASIAYADSPPLDFGPPYVVTGGFNHPFGLAVDNAHGRLLVADTGNHRFKFRKTGDLAAALPFTDFGYIANRQDPNALTDPQALAVDGEGNVYVVNTLKGDVKQFAWNGGNYTINPAFCKNNPHTVDGIAIDLPRDVAVGSDGAIYLLDSGNKRILKAAGANATAWTVLKSDASWSNPYGLAVDPAGNIYLADTGNHRILKIAGGTTVASYGHWGRGSGEFRYPRGVAVDQYGRMFVADTYNHRIQILAADGQHLIDIGHAPALSTIDKVTVDSSDRVFAVDSDRNHVLAFLGADVAAPFDAYVRDYVGDTGAQPSSASFLISSPDVLIRHQPDVDMKAAAAAGLESYGFQQPLYDATNYVYVALRNTGKQSATDNFLKLYWYDPGSPSHFPADWNEKGFFSAYQDAAHNTPSNTLAVPIVAPNGVVVVGPLLWRPPSPFSAKAADGRFRLAVRVINLYDLPPVGDSTTMPRDSNNVTERRVMVVSGPSPAGEQNTLIARVHYKDLLAATDENTTQTRANELAAWIQEVSYGAATVSAMVVGPVVTPHEKSYYATPSKSLLIELTTDILNTLLANNPALLDGPGPGHEITRVILVTNDLDDSRDWATSGAWPFMVNGKTRYLTASVQGGNNPMPFFAHGLSHQLSMLDLYAHENVTFPRPYVDGWDNMAKPFTGAHPLVWSKELSTWVSTRSAKIVFVPRPKPGATWNNGGKPISLWFQETAAPGQTVGVAFGLTNGVTSLADETAFYYVEARKNSGGPGAAADTVLPQTGVIMYYANSAIPQGQGPIILRDHFLGGSLADAAFVNGYEAPEGTGIVVAPTPGTGGADYDLKVTYNPLPFGYDVYMRPGDPAWKSPDVWVDNQKNGYDKENKRWPQDRGDLAIAGEENRVYAQVFNHGPASAYDIEVAFFLSEPFHTVGDQGSFDELKSVFIDILHSDKVETRYISWTPKKGVNPHTCARVVLRRLFDDTNSANNWAQRNLEVDHSVHGSPYTPVEFSFQVRNDQKTPEVIYFRPDGIPDDWTWSVTPPKVFLDPGQTGTATLKLQPPPSAPDCNRQSIYMTGWVPRGDTLIRLGGVTVDVDLQSKTKVDVHAVVDRCRENDDRAQPAEANAVTKDDTYKTMQSLPQPGGGELHVPFFSDREEALFDHATALMAATSASSTTNAGSGRCARIVASGCTDPKQPNQDIVIKYKGPDGKPVYHTVHTDANGCYEDFNVVIEGGNWAVDAEFPGDRCYGPSTEHTMIAVPLPPVAHPQSEFDPEQRMCITTFSADAQGEIVRSATEAAPPAASCRTTAVGQTVRLKITPTEGNDAVLSGEIEITYLHHYLSSTAGVHAGTFVWKGAGFVASGEVNGLTSIGTHRPAICATCAETDVTPNHWELSLDGVVVEGLLRGDRIHAVVAADLEDPNTVQATLEGVIEHDADLSREAAEQRIRRDRSKSVATCDTVPCLERISRAGTGKLVLDETETERCDPSTGSYKTTSRFVADVGDGQLVVPRFTQALDSASHRRGEHGGVFVYEGADGSEVAGTMFGMTRAGTHRWPLREAFESFDEDGHLEGRLAGVVLNGRSKGARVEARYAISINKGSDRRRSTFRIAIEGWQISGCDTAPQQ